MMVKLGSVFPSALVLVGLFHGYCSQICNVTVPIRSSDGTIQERTQLGCCPGYYVARIPKSKQTYCKAKCTKQCVNAKCTAPNVCTCKPGYAFASEFTTTKCVPQCDNCTNGSCVRPNQCQCRQKFHKNEEGVCVPTCNPPCLNGTCVSANVCKCDEGFKFVNLSKNRCEPACEKPCVNGFCSGVNECTCWEGWTLDIDEPHKCTRRECRNGVMDGRGNCLCEDHHQELLVYERDNRIISECVDRKISACGGKCIDSACPVDDVCECESGFRKATMEKEFKCIPVCDQECVNGKCVAPNQCQCLEGYTAEDHKDLSQCSPVCDQECTNGYCSGPNECTCNEGYAKNEGSTMGYSPCLPICGPCKENEECVAPGQCQCRKKNFVVTANGDCQEIICILGQISDGRCLCADGYFLDETNTCREILMTTTEKIEELPASTERSFLETSLDPLANQQSSEEDEIYRNSQSSYTEREIVGEAETFVTESDMEIVPTTKAPICLNGRLINGKCTCPDGYIQMMDNECVARTTIEYKVPETVPPKIVCSEKCLTGMCHSNGTCKCPLHYKLSPEDETECIQGTVCEVCLNDDLFPCPPHCLAMEYSPSVKSKVPQYLIIILACFIACAAVILFLVFYKRMKKHEYYTGPVATTEPIYAYDMEVLT